MKQKNGFNLCRFLHVPWTERWVFGGKGVTSLKFEWRGNVNEIEQNKIEVRRQLIGKATFFYDIINVIVYI